MTDDLHVHVQRRVIEADGAVRGAMADILGAVPDSPAEVTTGCGLRVPYAHTSPRPESVTCLPCREFAGRAHLRFVEQLEFLRHQPGVQVDPADVTAAIARHRDLARRFE